MGGVGRTNGNEVKGVRPHIEWVSLQYGGWEHFGTGIGSLEGPLKEETRLRVVDFWQPLVDQTDSLNQVLRLCIVGSESGGHLRKKPPSIDGIFRVIGVIPGGRRRIH